MWSTFSKKKNSKIWTTEREGQRFYPAMTGKLETSLISFDQKYFLSGFSLCQMVTFVPQCALLT